MNLFKLLQKDNWIEYKKQIVCCLEDKLDWIEDREPEYYGKAYDIWEEKRDSLEEILNYFNDEHYNNDDDLRQEILLYQSLYGGLSRLKIIL